MLCVDVHLFVDLFLDVVTVILATAHVVGFLAVVLILAGSSDQGTTFVAKLDLGCRDETIFTQLIAL